MNDGYRSLHPRWDHVPVEASFFVPPRFAHTLDFVEAGASNDHSGRLQTKGRAASVASSVSASATNRHIPNHSVAIRPEHRGAR